ncbi:hypothetical protein LTR28_011123, partial [Elasticomyces elasticus]
MSRIYRWLAAPGTKWEVTGIAPTQQRLNDAREDQDASQLSSQTFVESSLADDSIEIKNATPVVIITDAADDNITGYVVALKPGLLDRWLDVIVSFFGSRPVFFVINALLLAWVLSSIRFSKYIEWQVCISDFQAILTYVLDSFLMRQQLNEYDVNLRVCATLRSRSESVKRMLMEIERNMGSEYYLQDALNAEKTPDAAIMLAEADLAAPLPKEGWFGRLATAISTVFGHIVTLALFWVGIVIWLAFGPSSQWSNNWQLYCNSATSALM